MLAVILLLSATISEAQTCPPACQGQVTILSNATDSAQARFDVMGESRRRVIQSVYIFADDTASFANAALLRERSRAGVDVTLIVDAVGARRMPAALIRYLQNEGVKVKIYHRFDYLDPFAFLRRMHDKVTVVDGEKLFVGDRNVANPYFGIGETAWRSMDALIEDKEEAEQAQKYLESLLSSEHVSDPPNSKVSQEELLRMGRELDLIERKIRGGSSAVKWQSQQEWRKGNMFPTTNATFVHETLSKSPDGETKSAIYDLIRSAQREIFLVTPYLVPTDGLMQELALAKKRGVHITLLTSAEKNNDINVVNMYYQSHLPEIAEVVGEIREHQGTTLHAKVAVADRQRVFIGSYNLNHRSERFDLESGVVSDNAEIASRVLDLFAKDVSTADVVAKDGKVASTKDCTSLRRRIEWLVTEPVKSLMLQ